ncbi:transposable element Tcb1 transposase [Trichonephila clavipes]|nr:transposable element Tcb1 transposase [Trichonephila clavipes]
MRQIGKGFAGAFKLCSTLNLPRLTKTAYKNQDAKLLKVVQEVAEESMIKAATEIVEKKQNLSSDILLRSTASDPTRQLSSVTGTTVSRQTMYRHIGHIGLYVRSPVRSFPLTAAHCRLRLTWRRDHALWTPQQCSCVMFSDESRFSLQSDSHQTLI